jgi:hypothetical protein
MIVLLRGMLWSARTRTRGRAEVCSGSTSFHHMSKTILIRHVPDRLHRRLKARAMRAGMSLSNCLLRELERIGAQYTAEGLRDRLAQLNPVALDEPAAAAVRMEREGR